MRSLRLLSLSVYLIAVLLLITGRWYYWQPSRVSGGVVIAARVFHLDETVWAPPHKDFQLQDFPPNRPQSLHDRGDDGYVRPAWGILTGMVLLFLYVLGTSHNITIHLY
jgi:hypothetical protein